MNRSSIVDHLLRNRGCTFGIHSTILERLRCEARTNKAGFSSSYAAPCRTIEEDNPKVQNNVGAPAREQFNWGEIAGIAIGAAVVTVAFLGIDFFVFRWIRRKFFAPEAQPPPQILLPPPAALLPPPPLPHVLQCLMQQGVNGGVQDMEALPPPAPQLPPPPPLPMQLMSHGGHDEEEPDPPPPPPPPMQLMPHEGHDDEEPYPPPPPLPPIHWIVQNGQVVHQPPHALPPNVLQWVLQHGDNGGGEEGGDGGGGEESFESMNVQIGDVFDVEAESVASCSFTGGGGAAGSA